MDFPKLDLQRLHHQSSARGSGRTTRMLVEVFGNFEYSEKTKIHAIFIHSVRQIPVMLRQIEWVAYHMGYRIEKVTKTRRTIVFDNGCVIKLVLPGEEGNLRGTRFRLFRDQA